jgi:hypothetical protein
LDDCGVTIASLKLNFFRTDISIFGPHPLQSPADDAIQHARIFPESAHQFGMEI